MPVAKSASADMTFPNTVKLLLIEVPSFNLSPLAPVFDIFSEPAKSTKFIYENFYIFLPNRISI